MGWYFFKNVIVLKFVAKITIKIKKKIRIDLKSIKVNNLLFIFLKNEISSLLNLVSLKVNSSKIKNHILSEHNKTVEIEFVPIVGTKRIKLTN